MSYLCLYFFIIIIRLFNLQIIGFEDNLKLSTYYSQRQVSIRASRGEILDKNGEVLATNVESYILEYSGINNSDSFFEVITEVLDILDKNGEDLYNNFEIKVDPFRFEFAVTSESEIRAKRA